MTNPTRRRPDHFDMDLSRLVAAAQAGDQLALDQLLRWHQPQVWRICRRMFANEADAADATQDALIAVVRGLGSFDGRSRFSTWLHRVTTNACLDSLRRRARRPATLVGDIDVVGDAVLVDHGPGFEDVVVDREVLDRAVASLPELHRTVLVLRELCELDYAEIAEVLDVPVGTVRSRLARARAHVAGACQPIEEHSVPAMAG